MPPLYHSIPGISIHALREESDELMLNDNVIKQQISIHALREESDFCKKRAFTLVLYFNPRSPWGERPGLVAILPYKLFISIHALREESDLLGVGFNSYSDINFNPRSPWGERHVIVIGSVRFCKFQSTLSVRRATFVLLRVFAVCFQFQSTLSVRRATGFIQIMLLPLALFQSTLSVRRATGARLKYYPAGFNFNPRSPWGERHYTANRYTIQRNFISIHALREESDMLLSQW